MWKGEKLINSKEKNHIAKGEKRLQEVLKLEQAEDVQSSTFHKYV